MNAPGSWAALSRVSHPSTFSETVYWAGDRAVHVTTLRRVARLIAGDIHASTSYVWGRPAREVAEQLGFCRQTIMAALAVLVDLGIIEVAHRPPGLPVLYRWIR